MAPRKILCACKRCNPALYVSCLGVLLLFIVHVIFELTDWIPVNERGFFCDDPNIMYPKKNETFSPWLVFGVLVVLPIFIFLAVELVVTKDAFAFLYALLYFVCAVSMSGVATDMIKSVVGRLRPYFIDICQPSVYPDGPCTTKQFVTNYTCSGQADAKDIREARKSFPSGHAAISFSCALFLVIYLWRRIPPRAPNVGRHLLVFLILLFALSIGVSRIMDYMHHPEDVFFGALIGIGAGVYSGLVWLHAVDNIPSPSPEPTPDSEIFDGTSSSDQKEENQQMDTENAVAPSSTYPGQRYRPQDTA